MLDDLAAAVQLLPPLMLVPVSQDVETAAPPLPTTPTQGTLHRFDARCPWVQFSNTRCTTVLVLGGLSLKSSFVTLVQNINLNSQVSI